MNSSQSQSIRLIIKFVLIVFAVAAAGISYADTKGMKSEKLLDSAERISDTHPPVSLTEIPAVPDLSYKLGVGDVLDIRVYGEQQLSDKYAIGQGGTISMPLIGEVYIEGLSVKEAEKLIGMKLANGYLVEPSVSIQVAQTRPFYILGEVKAPGSYNFVSDMTVLNAVALAGGFTYRANRDTVHILKPREGEDVYEKIAVEARVQPGDIILVKERFF